MKRPDSLPLSANCSIASLAQEAEEETTPLERRLNHLGQKLIYAIVAMAVLIQTVGVLTGKPIFLM